jgi:hypothetical protein
MLGRHRLLVCLFLVPFLIFYCLEFTSGTSADRPLQLDATLANEDTYSVTLPIVMGTYSETSDATFDLSIERIEVIQAVQDIANSIPLVKDRQTLVRVYIHSSASSELEGVRVSLSGISNGKPLVNSPLTQLGSVYQAADRGVYTSTYNFSLPSGWLDKDQVVLTALVDVDNLVCETNESNNAMTGTYTFTQVPAFDLVIVPIIYTHTPSGLVYGPPSDTISNLIYRLYPVPAMTVVLDQPLAFQGNLNLATGWMDLLEAVANLRTFNNAPEARTYYGLVPTGLGTGAWFQGGYAGLGYIGWRASVGLQLEDPMWGLDAGAFVAAHEIGHNLNSQHAPGCNAGNVDPNWPWPGDGHTHEYGLDLTTLTVKMPTSEDIMGYCRDGGQWISSYTYRKLLNDQQEHGIDTVSQQSQEVLFIRAILDENSQATLRPLYHLVAVPSVIPATSDYTVQLLDTKGNELACYAVDVKTAEGDDYTFRMISALVKIPKGEVTQVRLMKGTSVLAERQLYAGTMPFGTVKLTETERGLRLDWTSGGQAALIRYTNDEGATWSTLAFDTGATEITIDRGKVSTGGYFEVSFADTVLPVRLVYVVK